jgi:hypothetical protein
MYGLLLLLLLLRMAAGPFSYCLPLVATALMLFSTPFPFLFSHAPERMGRMFDDNESHRIKTLAGLLFHASGAFPRTKIDLSV